MKCISWWFSFGLMTLDTVINVRNEEVIKAFGTRIRELRKERGYTMEQLAGMAGIDYRQLSNIEHGRVNVTISTIFVLAKAFGLSISELTHLDQD
jgi:transcriptional regulator with XRE-family HTH domain